MFRKEKIPGKEKDKKVWLFELFFVLLQPITHLANKIWIL